MMDPEMIRLAQEQMSRIPPSEFMRMQQQMMSNPDLIRMAADSMKNLKADDIRFAAEQMKRLNPEDMAEMSARLATASPDEIAAMRVQANAQQAYEYQGSLSLKNQGNQLHGVGKYGEAIEKYDRAKQNLLSIRTPEAASLRQVCSLNLMSCYLKTGKFEETVEEGSEVLLFDANNLKALYRRGQAYKELGKLKLAFADLSKAANIAPDDETVQSSLRQLQDQLSIQGEIEDEHSSVSSAENEPIIEEVSFSEVETFSTTSSQRLGINEQVMPAIPKDVTDVSQALNNLKQNPEVIRSMHSMMSSLPPEQVAAMTGGKMSPEMAKMASDMIKQMSADDMQKMLDMVSSLENQSTTNMPSTSTSTSVTSDSPSLTSDSLDINRVAAGMQDKMKHCMKDPIMKQMMTSMVQNMTTENMVAMSEQMGLKLSMEEAEKAKTAMASLSPDALDRMMKWADRLQRVSETAMKTKNFLLGRSGLILAIVMLIIAVVLHWLGVIGS